MSNPARDLAATGTPGPWHAVIDPDEPSDTPIADDNGYLCVSPDDGVRGGHSLADALKIVRAVNALPAIADLLDAIDALGDVTPAANQWDVVLIEGAVFAASDAVAAALTGETP